MKILLETDRLYLRELEVDDAESFYLLNLDEEVIRYTGDVPFANVRMAREFLENYDHYNRYGFGRWAVISKEDSNFMGWCGLKYTEELDEYDIGFRFFRRYWNQGYASEAAAACIDLGVHQLKIAEIVGRARKENVASIRVLEKIGLVYEKDFDFEGNNGVIYKLK